MLTRDEQRDDRGAVAVIVAVLLAAVALPMLMFVVDVGGLYTERRQLQHSADAGAMAVALSCATSCTTEASRVLADSYANGNAVRGADLDDDTTAPVCGSVTGLPACDPPPADPDASPYDCEAEPPAGMRYVQVRVDSAGAGWDAFFATDPTDVSACARVRTDAPLASLSGGFPITMSICEWNAATSDGTDYAPPPATPPAYALSEGPSLRPYERVVGLQRGTGSPSTTDPTGCDRGPAGSYVPGGFGWLEGAGCTAEVEDGTAIGGTGSSEELECRTTLQALVDSRQPIYIPVHDTVVESGREFNIIGYAAFVVTGYDLTSAGRERSWVSGGFPDCTGAGGSGKCISGFFTQALTPTPGDTTGTGPSFGATTVARIP